MSRRDVRLALLVALAAGASALPVRVGAEPGGSAWPQFRGLNRDGASPETGLADRWPVAGPPQVWRVPLGPGFSAISVVGPRLFTMYAADHEGKPTEFAAAFDAATGKETWRVALGERYDTEFGHGPRSTPTVDGDTVYVLDSRGNLAALATADGATRWKRSLTADFAADVPTFGFSMSALVDGDLLLLEAGGKEGKGWLGLNKKTGEVQWSTGDGPASYSSPLAVNGKDRKRYVFVSGKKLACMDEKGQEIWSHAWPEGETHAMPLLVAPSRIYASGAEGVGARLLEIDEGAERATVKELWHNPVLRNHFSSAVVHGGHIYGFDNATLKAIAVADSELAWAKRGFGKGSLILVDGKLLVLSDRGRLTLVQAAPDAYAELGGVQALEGRCWTAPVLSGGRVYLRNDVEMVAYDLTR